MRMVVVDGVRYREDEAPKETEPEPRGKARTARDTHNKAARAPEPAREGAERGDS